VWIEFEVTSYVKVDVLTLAGAAEQIERGEISPVELTEAFLERIRRLNPMLNAFITVTEEEALRDARQAEKEIRDGKYRGPLHGIPVAIKDMFDTAGIRTTAGSRILAQNIPSSDATAVARLRENGAVVVGKANLHEWAFGVTNDNPHFGATKNPWDIDRIPGGSSGGSAVAVSARMCLGALGTDTGGSIRVPASACGIVGIKPTRGLVSVRGVIPLSWSLDHAGPMALTTRDLAILLFVIAGYDEADPVSVQRSIPVNYEVEMCKGVQGLRIAVPTNHFFDAIDDDVQKAVRNAIVTFEHLDASITEIAFEKVEEDPATNRIILGAEASTLHLEHLNSSRSNIGNDVLERLRRGLETSPQDYVLARRIQDERRRARALFFEKFDVLVTPTIPSDPPVREGLNAVNTSGNLTRFTSPFNLTGLPAISIPCGFSRKGLPIGMQLVAKHWNEALLFRAAFAYENATGWYKQKPNL
jgi:aspartyl-tRNA(Asn)/glutamyl-tRNA(Gln) amidotransferase subunit A